MGTFIRLGLEDGIYANDNLYTIYYIEPSDYLNEEERRVVMEWIYGIHPKTRVLVSGDRVGFELNGRSRWPLYRTVGGSLKPIPRDLLYPGDV